MVFTKPPALICKLPFTPIVDDEPKSTPPANVTLLKVIVPETVAVPRKLIEPPEVPEAIDPLVDDTVPDEAIEIVLLLPILKVPAVSVRLVVVRAEPKVFVTVFPELLMVIPLTVFEDGVVVQVPVF